jgi:hypothetical protein
VSLFVFYFVAEREMLAAFYLEVQSQRDTFTRNHWKGE